MKRVFLTIMALALFLLCCCSEPDENSLPKISSEPKEELMEYEVYNLHTYVRPFWQGEVVYNETVLFVGEDDCAPLFFDAEELVAVMSYDLCEVYYEGIDYIIQDSTIKLTDNTRIPYFTHDEYYPKQEISGKTKASTVMGKPFILFGEGSTFTSRQIAVTYYHKSKYNGELPENQSAKFKKALAKMKNKENVKVLFYGDSITTGANSSSKVGQPPMAETYPQMVVSYLKSHFGYDDIEYINTAVGGKTTSWAIENVQSSVIDYRPDILFLAFGMNDRGLTASAYRQQTKTLTDRIKESLPDVEIMLVSPMLPNSEVAGYYSNQYLFEDELEQLTKDDIGLAKVTTMHKELLKRKRYRDMTGNNVNHPNDFLARVYAQTILAALLGIGV